MRSYLDHNATSILRPAVKAAMVAAMECVGNASSVHAEGRSAHRLMDEARDALGFALGCLPQMISFTGSGTEANNMAVRGVAVERVLVSAVEHASVLAAARASGKVVEIIAVDGDGRVDLSALETLLVGSRALVCVMLANNETGVVQPIAEVVRLAHAAGSLVHVDAVQAFGKQRVNFGVLGCDLMTIAAHKVGGPIGIGALVIRDGLVVEPLLVGGGQELRRRAGTENLIAIAGFAAIAAEPLLDCAALTARLQAGLGEVVVFGAGVERLNNTICFGRVGMKAETLLMGFDLDGIAVSSGSACSSGKVGRSHVLAAMGVEPELASSAIRVSLGWNTSETQVDQFIGVWNKLVARHIARLAA
jgi:cysteine desulfurase